MLFDIAGVEEQQPLGYLPNRGLEDWRIGCEIKESDTCEEPCCSVQRRPEGILAPSFHDRSGICILTAGNGHLPLPAILLLLRLPGAGGWRRGEL